MALANRCRLHVAAALRRGQAGLLLSSPAPSISRRLDGFSDGGVSERCPRWLNPSYGGVLGSPALVRHFSWWRWGGGSSVGQVEDGGAVEPPSRVMSVEEDGIGDGDESGQELGLGSGDGELGDLSWHGKVDMEEETVRLDGGLTSMSAADEVVEGGGGSVFWSTLQVPTDAIIVTLDRFQNITGVPWWLTIIGSTLALRVALFPLTVTQLQKASLLARLGSQLPPPVARSGSGQTFASQYRIFTKRRLELGAPSPAWLIAVPLIQVPLFIYWIVAVRQMAMASHPGFDTGGILWFTDLTVPVQGALGALFPIIVAATYLTNLQVLFYTMLDIFLVGITMVAWLPFAHALELLDLQSHCCSRGRQTLYLRAMSVLGLWFLYLAVSPFVVTDWENNS